MRDMLTSLERRTILLRRIIKATVIGRSATPFGNKQQPDHGFRTTHTTARPRESLPTTRRVPSDRTSLSAFAAAQRPLNGSCTMPIDSDQK